MTAGCVATRDGCVAGALGLFNAPRSRWEQQHPLGCVAALFPIGQRTPFNAPRAGPCPDAQR